MVYVIEISLFSKPLQRKLEPFKCFPLVHIFWEISPKYIRRYVEILLLGLSKKEYMLYSAIAAVLSMKDVEALSERVDSTLWNVVSDEYTN